MHRIHTAACLFVPLLLFGQHGSTTRSNPFNTPDDQAEGGRLFKKQCAACHGPNGAGGAAGPDLTTGTSKRGDGDDVLFEIVAKGLPGTPMPAYAGSGREIWQIVAYLRTLTAGKAAERAKGDRVRGAQLFASSGCRKCHTVHGEGGDLGPDLTNAGARYTLSYLQRSLTDPNYDVSADHWMLRARTNDGRQIFGVRLNEDTHSYQYREGGRLKALLKTDVAEARIEKRSVMPSFKDKLNPGQIDDLVAYLATLKEREQ